MLHVTCDQAGVHTPTEWLLQLPGAATHRPLVATYATVDHQALTPGIAARVSLKKITLVSWTRGRGLYFTCYVSLLVCIFWSVLLIFNGWMLEAASSVRAVGRV